MRRAEIDTSAPFKSVKEAVALFGERVLAGELYPNKLKEMQPDGDENGTVRTPVTTELEETKQKLDEAREDRMLMATCLSSLQQELERTKYELRQLKHDSKNHIPDIKEDLKFIEEDVAQFENSSHDHATSGAELFQQKRYVTFANPASVGRVVVQACDAEVLERHPSLRKKKKKPLIPLIGGIFSRKKNVIKI